MTDPTLSFDDYELRPQPLALLRAGRPVALPAQPLRLLQLLASRAGEVVDHAEIREHLWGDQVVDFAGGVHVCIRQIRAALGDSGTAPRYIENIPRRGYRFLADVRVEPVLTPRPERHRLLAGVTIGVVVVVLAAGVWMSSRGATHTQQVDAESPARDAYLRGRYLLESNEPNHLARSREFFGEAIDADPNHAPAFAAMADSYQREFDFAVGRIFAERALELDDGLAEAHLRVAAVLGLADWQWVDAEAHILEALALDPESVEAHHALATVYSVTGRLEQAVEPMERALALDPASTLLRADYGSFLYYLGRLDQAHAQCSAALRLDPAHPASRMCLIDIAADRGRYAQAVTLAATIMREHQADEALIAEVLEQPTASGVRAFQHWRLGRYARADPALVSPTDFAMIHARLGDHGAALAFLEQAVDERRTLTPFVVLDPVFVPLRDQERFRKILRAMNVELS